MINVDQAFEVIMHQTYINFKKQLNKRGTGEKSASSRVEAGVVVSGDDERRWR